MLLQRSSEECYSRHSSTTAVQKETQVQVLWFSVADKPKTIRYTEPLQNYRSFHGDEVSKIYSVFYNYRSALKFASAKVLVNLTNLSLQSSTLVCQAYMKSGLRLLC